MPSQALQNMMRDLPAAVLSEVTAVEKDRDAQLDQAAQTLVALRKENADLKDRLKALETGEKHR